MKQFLLFVFSILAFHSIGQLDGNTTPTYHELIEMYRELSAEHEEIELYNMGTSDYGLPIYLCIVNGAQDSTKTFQKAQEGTTLLINNAIHPGEPDGVNACLLWINDWIKSGKSKKIPVVAIIPAYNIGGMMNRSGTSRANQNGPEEYGFRGNAQNLDLNRDFIKMDSENMFTFARIYHALDPDVFIDTHVSNGADYQYTMTYIASVRERMAKPLGNLMHDTFIPFLKKASKKEGFDLIPYVHLHDKVPDNGIEAFNDLPRYAMGYASLMGAMSFTTETHMLKPFPDRVQATLVFVDKTIRWMENNSGEIEKARTASEEWEKNQKYFRYNYRITQDSTSINFKGFEHSYPISKVTGLPQLTYNQEKPFEKEVPYFNSYAPKDSIEIPYVIIVEGQCKEVINCLKANNVEMVDLDIGKSYMVKGQRVLAFENGKKPYEGHFLHRGIKAELFDKVYRQKKGDVMIYTTQKNARFILSVLMPEAPDSYFAWNFFDSYVQQKEYFSPYVFEDKAEEILKSNEHLRKEFEIKKNTDPSFEESAWDQLYFIYKNSEFFEPSHNVLPVHFGVHPKIK